MRCVTDTVEPSPFAHEILNSAALRVPRRRAARGAPHARGVRCATALPRRRARPGAARRPPRSRRCAKRRRPTSRDADELHELLCGPGRRAQTRPARRAVGARRRCSPRVARPGSRAPTRARVRDREHGARARALPRRARSSRSPRCLPRWRTSRATRERARRRRPRPPVDPRAHDRGRARDADRRRRAARSSRRSRGSRAAASRCAGASSAELGCEQFCERGLLARIHRYRWRGFAPRDRAGQRAGVPALPARVAAPRPGHPSSRARAGCSRDRDLSGFEAAAGAWEIELLPARVDGYKPALLDALCLVGRRRLGARVARERRARHAAVAADADLCLPARRARRAAAARRLPRRWRIARRCAGPPSACSRCCARARAVRARDRGAPRACCRSQLEEGLRELVAQGLVSCDGFAPLRRLLGPSPRRDLRRRSRPRARAAVRPAHARRALASARRARPPRPTPTSSPSRSPGACCAATASCSAT